MDQFVALRSVELSLIGMSVLGHKQTFEVALSMSALPPKADIGWELL